MKYFKVSPLERPPCAQLHDPVDAEGRSVYSGQPLECAGPVTAELVFPELTLLLDFMSCATGQLVLSHRAAAIIEKFWLQEGWQSIPCRIVTERGQVLRNCVCFHFPKFLDVLDEEKSEFKPMRHKSRGPVVHPVLKRSLTGPYDLCKGIYVGFVCSENLATAIKAEGLEGFVFEELECVD
jgi:hypothetical protein